MATFEELEQNRINHKNTPYDPNNVMPKKCASCPWGDNPIGKEHGEEFVQFMLAELALKGISESNQLCHSPALKGQPEVRICRGMRDFQLRVYHGLGLLKEPTDDCWRETLEQLNQKHSNE